MHRLSEPKVILLAAGFVLVGVLFRLLIAPGLVKDLEEQ